jgi:hypothetical protein
MENLLIEKERTVDKQVLLVWVVITAATTSKQC